MQYRFYIFAFLSLLSLAITASAHASCNTGNGKCSDVKVEKFIGHGDGYIYVSLSSANIAGICTPATMDGVEGVQFASIHKDALNFYGVSAILKIAHEQDRILHQIDLQSGSQGCVIEMVYSTLD